MKLAAGLSQMETGNISGVSGTGLPRYRTVEPPGSLRMDVDDKLDFEQHCKKKNTKKIDERTEGPGTR